MQLSVIDHDKARNFPLPHLPIPPVKPVLHVAQQYLYVAKSAIDMKKDTGDGLFTSTEIPQGSIVTQMLRPFSVSSREENMTLTCFLERRRFPLVCKHTRKRKDTFKYVSQACVEYEYTSYAMNNFIIYDWTLVNNVALRKDIPYSYTRVHGRLGVGARYARAHRLHRYKLQHSHKHANCKLHVVKSNHEILVYWSSLRMIAPGEELTFRYSHYPDESKNMFKDDEVLVQNKSI